MNADHSPTPTQPVAFPSREACESCAQLAEQNHALQERAVGDRERIDALVNRITKADQENAGLRGQLTQLRTDSPKMADAEDVFRFWVQRLHKNARTNFGPKRQEKVKARLAEKSAHPDLDRKAELKWAVRGCEALPCVGPKGRQASGGKRHDDLALICRDETTVERFMGYADEQADGAFRTFVMVLMDRGLVREAGVSTSHDGQPFHVTATCPVCSEPWALVAMPGTASLGDLLWIECRSGCSPDEIKERLRGPVLEVAA